MCTVTGRSIDLKRQHIRSCIHFSVFQPDLSGRQIARNVQSKHGIYMWTFKAALRDHARCAANGLLCRLE